MRSYPLSYINGLFWFASSIRDMNRSPNQIQVSKEAPRAEPSHSAEALRILEEYAKDLREIIEKLRRRLH